jgi:uncharacterized membrane-anchored protein YitT (DUF2179 family)
MVAWKKIGKRILYHFFGVLVMDEKEIVAAQQQLKTKQVSNKEIAEIVWKNFGERLIFVCGVNIATYFFVMGPTSLGWFILGSFTYSVAHNLFYMGSCLLAFITGFTIIVKIFMKLPESR